MEITKRVENNASNLVHQSGPSLLGTAALRRNRPWSATSSAGLGNFGSRWTFPSLGAGQTGPD